MAHFLTPSLNTFQKIIVLMQSVKNKCRRNSIVIKKKYAILPYLVVFYCSMISLIN